MTNKQAIKKIESLLKKSMTTLVKDVNSILKEAEVWYCEDDLIKSRPEMNTPNDRNADQLVIDFAADAISGALDFTNKNLENSLWKLEDIEAK